MKNFWMIGILLVLGITGIGLFSSGCGSSPSNPAGTNPTPTPPAATPTVTSTPTVSFSWYAPYIQLRTFNGTPYKTAEVNLQVNGQPVTNAAVTLTDSTLATAWPLAYSAPETEGGQVYATYNNQTAISYNAGDTYTLTTTDLGQTASCSITLPGGVVTQADSNGAVTEVYCYGGSTREIAIVETNPSSLVTYEVYPTTASPFSVPVTAYNENTGYSFDVEVYNTTSVTSIPNISLNGSYFFARQYYDQTINF